MSDQLENTLVKTRSLVTLVLTLYYFTEDTHSHWFLSASGALVRVFSALPRISISDVTLIYRRSASGSVQIEFECVSSRYVVAWYSCKSKEGYGYGAF